MTRVVDVAAQIDVDVCNALDPPTAGTNVGGGIHVVIPPDYVARVAAGQKVAGCTYTELQPNSSMYMSSAAAAKIEDPQEVAKLTPSQQAEAALLLSFALCGCGAAHGPQTPVPLDATTRVDSNSLVPGYLADPSWQVDPQAAARPCFLAMPDVPGPDGLTGYVLDVNAGKVAASWSRFFVAPQAATFGSVVASVSVKVAHGASPGVVTIKITDPNETVILKTASVTTSSSWQTLSTTSLSITPGHRYSVRVYATGTHALFGRVSLTPSAPSDAWWSGSIRRTSVHPQDLADNSFPIAGDERGGGQVPVNVALSPLHYYYADPDSTYSFSFDGTRFGVELYTHDNQFGLCGLDVLVDGALFTKVQGTNLLDSDVASVTGLPPGPKTVTIQTAAQKWLVNYDLLKGAWLHAVYTDAADAMVPIAPPPVGGGIVMFGTSKMAGFFAGGEVPSGDPSALGIVVRLRAGQAKRVIAKAIGSVSLFSEYIAPSTDVQQLTGRTILPFARDIIASAPSVFIIEADHNDAGQGWSSVAEWSAQYQILLDAVLAALPDCEVWMIYSTNDTTPPANIAAFDAEQDAIVAARPRIRKLDLRTLWTSAQASLHTVDGIHPDAGGCGEVATYILNAIATPPPVAPLSGAARGKGAGAKSEVIPNANPGLRRGMIHRDG